MRLYRKGVIGATLAAVAVLAASCSSGGGSKTTTATSATGSVATTAPATTAAKVSVTVASFNFGESEILANMYKDVLQKAGVNVTLRDKLGAREVVEPALQSGQIDLVPEYVGTALEFLNKNAGEASGDLTATVTKLQARFTPLGVTVLDPSPAADQNAFAVSKTTATKDNLKNMSDLAPYASKMTLGGPPECPTRPFCQLGLQKTYGLTFKSFKALDSDGPLTKSALKNGQIDVGLVFSSDGDLNTSGLVVLNDDKHLQTVDNIVPVIRTDKATPAVTAALNAVSAKLTTDALVQLNQMVSIDKADPSQVAQTWLSQNGLA
jgi:osmoprotectant transport system substrate-binding protein